jgi:hypothetical protein
LVEYATQIDRGQVLVDEEDPAASPYALLAASVSVPCQQSPMRTLSPRERDRRLLERGVQLLHAAVDQYMRDPPEQGIHRVFRGNPPRTFRQEADWARDDLGRYQRLDRGRIKPAKFFVPRRLAPVEVVEQTCGILTAPESEMFKVWARRDGFAMLVVETEKPSLYSAENEEIRLRRFVISVLPDSGLTLADLGKVLDELETERRKFLTSRTKLDLNRRGPPRRFFGNSDPWYDGRSEVLANTIVDAPRQGSVLQLEEVLAVMGELYGASAGRDG